MRTLLVAALMFGAFAAVARADPPPPTGAKPLSEILQSIEQDTDFGYFDEVEWDDGFYEVEFYTNDGTKKKLYIDPITGERRS